MTVVFHTRTELDPRSFTTFGINAKPNSSSPIGFFGTGLKYAIAVLLREGCEVEAWIGKKHHKFNKERDTFRDKEFDFIVHRSGSFLSRKEQRLPFTTELGKTWKLWQAFRELYSNTLDEGGDVHLMQDGERWEPANGNTLIIVHGAEFENEFHERDKVFLPDGERNRKDGEAVQIINRPSNHVYYRGMRVHDLAKPSAVTYNVLSPLDLTEDRTAKYSYYVDHAIVSAIAQSKEAPIIDRVLTAGEDKYEHKINFADHHEAPSTAFEYVVRKLREEKRSHNSSAFFYTNRFDAGTLRAEAKKPWSQKAVEALEKEDWDRFVQIVQDNKEAVVAMLNVQTDIANRHEEDEDWDDGAREAHDATLRDLLHDPSLEV